jgi:uncharacterized tellurite resistance protein B-like protein
MEALATDLLDTLTDPEIDALVEIMLLAAYVDGAISQAESATLKRSLRAVDEHWLSHIDLVSRIDQAKQRILAESRAARLAKLRTMLPWPEQRVLALQLALRIVHADGDVAQSEHDLILETAEALGVSRERMLALAGKTA